MDRELKLIILLVVCGVVGLGALFAFIAWLHGLEAAFASVVVPAVISLVITLAIAR